MLQNSISVRGEVYFPNLLFDKDTVDFACIPNDTEATRYLQVSNNSPLPVNYKWKFKLINPCKGVALFQTDLLSYLQSSSHGLRTAQSISSEMTRTYFELVVCISLCGIFLELFDTKKSFSTQFSRLWFSRHSSLNLYINPSLVFGVVPSVKLLYITPLLKKVNLDPALQLGLRSAFLPTDLKIISAVKTVGTPRHTTNSWLLDVIKSSAEVAECLPSSPLDRDGSFKSKADILCAVDSSENALLKFLDLSPALVTVDHVTLLSS